MANGKVHKSVFSRISFGAVCVFFAVLQVLSYISGYINPAKAWFMTVFGLLFVPLLLVNIGLLVWGIIRKSWFTIAPAVAILLSLTLAGRFIQFGGGDKPSGPVITVITYNVGHFSCGIATGDKVEVADKTMGYLASSGADIICLQEFYAPGGQEITDYVAQFFPGWSVDYFVSSGTHGSGNVTISRFPSVDRGVHDFEKSANRAVHSDYIIAGRRIRVYNCHFESYNISLSHFVTTRSKVSETETKMERAITRRPRQVEEVLSDIEACSLPSIVAGDFNDNPLSYTYNRLVRGRKDAFVAAGSGFGATYSALWPLLRIVFVLYPDLFKVCSYKVDRDAPWSDHYPVITKSSL